MIASHRKTWSALGLLSVLGCGPLLGCGDSQELVCGEGTLRVGDVCISRGPFDAGADAGADDAASEPDEDAGEPDADAGPEDDAGGTVDAGPGGTVSGVTGGTVDGTTPDGGTPDAGSQDPLDGSTPMGGDAGSDAGSADAGNPPPDGEKHRLLVSDDGVALVQTANARVLSATVSVLDNLGRSTAWSATSDQAWLTLRAGAAPGELVLEASTAGLALDTVHYARVSLTSSDASVEQTESVRVGLWVSASTDAQKLDIAVQPVARALAADPIRPFMYVHSGGPDILVYNVHDGRLVDTLAGIAPQIGALTPSSDGSWLYVTDRTNFAVIPVNLDTGLKAASWLPVTRPQGQVYTRNNGKKLLIDSAAGVLDADSGQKLASTGEGGAIGVSRDGTRFCILNVGISPYTFICRTLTVSDVRGVRLGEPRQNNQVFGGPVGSNGQDIALSPDGSRIYVASGAPYEFDVFSAELMSQVQVLAGEPYPTNVEVLEDGRILAGANSAYEPIDAWLYDVQGNPLNTYRLGGYTGALMANTLRPAGDATRVVGITDEFSRPENPTLHIRTLAR